MRSRLQNMPFITALITSSTNHVMPHAMPAYELELLALIVNTASPQVSTASFSDNAVYAFMVENPNGSNLLQQDLEQIHEDDLEVMDLKWQLSLLSMRVKSEFEKVKQEKEGIEFKIEKFDKASKDIDKLLGSQITDKSKKGLGYSAVPPPHLLIYNRPNKLDLSYSGLDEFKEPEFKGYGTEDSKVKIKMFLDIRNPDGVPKVESVKPKNHEKLVKKSVRYAEMYRSQTPRGNQRNWNGQKLSANTIKGKGWTVNTAHPKSTVLSAKPMSCFPKTAQSTAVNTARPQAVNTARPTTVKTARPNSVVVNAIRVNQANAGKPQQDDTGFVDNGCSRHMTGNIAYL
ncbi:hypothetical protein Tco_0790185 [Tanacetum coccineum]